MYCKKCGAKMSEGETFCSNCGYNNSSSSEETSESQNIVPSVTKVKNNTMAILGLVISGISLLLNFWGLVGIAGTIVSVIGLIECNNKKENGRVLAIVGICIGGYSILYGLYGLISLAG